MKISYCSDTHLEFGYQTLPGGDVLILAGDICESRSMQKDYKRSIDVDHAPGNFPCWDFFNVECAKYNKVFYVMGNHEHYHGKFHKTYDEIKSILPSNITLLEKEVVEYNGVIFLGGTLWTDIDKGNPLSVLTIKDFMNDYKTIHNFYPAKNVYYKLTPNVTMDEHRKTKEYFKCILEMHRDKPVVVITHMAPSFQSVHEKYKGSASNAGFASAMDDFILDHENIRVWVHGHMHDPLDYMIGNTRVLANPRGYVPYELGNGFNPSAFFEI